MVAPLTRGQGIKLYSFGQVVSREFAILELSSHTFLSQMPCRRKKEVHGSNRRQVDVSEQCEAGSLRPANCRIYLTTRNFTEQKIPNSLLQTLLLLIFHEKINKNVSKTQKDDFH